MTDPLPSYHAALQGATWVKCDDRRWLEVRGSDTHDFLQRLLTSKVPSIEVGRGQWSALVDGRARWITDLLLFGLKNGVALDCPTSQLPALEETLENRHFGEDVRWHAPQETRLLVLGPQAQALVEATGLSLPTSEFSLFGETAEIQDPNEVRRVTRPDRGAQCWECSGSPERIAALTEALTHAGAVAADPQALEILRIEALRPLFGTDFGPESSLPESGEWQRASLNKGCYPGQEVIAKIHNFGEAPRQLCQLQFDALPKDEKTPKSLQGTPILATAGGQAGAITSCLESPREGGLLGMGIVRRKFLSEELFVEISPGSNVAVRATPLKQPIPE